MINHASVLGICLILTGEMLIMSKRQGYLPKRKLKTLVVLVMSFMSILLEGLGPPPPKSIDIFDIVDIISMFHSHRGNVNNVNDVNNFFGGRGPDHPERFFRGSVGIKKSFFGGDRIDPYVAIAPTWHNGANWEIPQSFGKFSTPCGCCCAVPPQNSKD